MYALLKCDAQFERDFCAKDSRGIGVGRTETARLHLLRLCSLLTTTRELLHTIIPTFLSGDIVHCYFCVHSHGGGVADDSANVYSTDGAHTRADHMHSRHLYTGAVHVRFHQGCLI